MKNTKSATVNLDVRRNWIGNITTCFEVIYLLAIGAAIAAVVVSGANLLSLWRETGDAIGCLLALSGVMVITMTQYILPISGRFAWRACCRGMTKGYPWYEVGAYDTARGLAIVNFLRSPLGLLIMFIAGNLYYRAWSWEFSWGVFAVLQSAFLGLVFLATAMLSCDWTVNRVTRKSEQ